MKRIREQEDNEFRTKQERFKKLKEQQEEERRSHEEHMKKMTEQHNADMQAHAKRFNEEIRFKEIAANSVRLFDEHNEDSPDNVRVKMNRKPAELNPVRNDEESKKNNSASTMAAPRPHQQTLSSQYPTPIMSSVAQQHYESSSLY